MLKEVKNILLENMTWNVGTLNICLLSCVVSSRMSSSSCLREKHSYYWGRRVMWANGKEQPNLCKNDCSGSSMDVWIPSAAADIANSSEHAALDSHLFTTVIVKLALAEPAALRPLNWKLVWIHTFLLCFCLRHFRVSDLQACAAFSCVQSFDGNQTP